MLVVQCRDRQTDRQVRAGHGRPGLAVLARLLSYVRPALALTTLASNTVQVNGPCEGVRVRKNI